MQPMNYLTYSGNNLINARLPEDATILYPQPPLPGIARHDIRHQVRCAFENPKGMEPLKELVGGDSKVLIAFDDNCQPFPPMARPDIRQTCIETLLEMLYSYGVEKSNIQLRCAVALHRKMKPRELEYMLGRNIMQEFYPEQLKNFDAEDPDDIVNLGETDHGECVETSRAVVECDLVIYVDTIQIPLNGGHKAVAVGFGSYRTIAEHHAPKMTSDSPHVMQPEGSHMHCSIRRISNVIEKHAKIMVMEAAMNNRTYPSMLSHLGKPPERCNPLEKAIRALTPLSLKPLPRGLKHRIFSGIKSDYQPLEISAGSIDAVHPKTVELLKKQLLVDIDRQFDTLVFGLADLSPYSIDARVNPVLVVSDVLGYVFNWFYGRPFVKKGGAVIILHPVDEVFHPQYHAAYQRFWDEVLPTTSDPFEMHASFQEKFALDPGLIDAYRNNYAHHGFHPFTVWYWATYPLKYLSQVILVGPKDGKAAERLGVSWAPNLDQALEMAQGSTGGDDVLALTVPPFMYLTLD